MLEIQKNGIIYIVLIGLFPESSALARPGSRKYHQEGDIMTIEQILGTIFGVIVSLGMIVAIIALIVRFRHSILRAAGVVTLVLAVLMIIVAFIEAAPVLIYLVPAIVVIVVVVIWLKRR